MTGCCVPKCHNSTRKRKSMRAFPRDPARRMQWATNIGRANWTPKDCSKICAEHFASSMWEQTRVDGKRALKCNAVPTIFPNHISGLSKEHIGPAINLNQPSVSVEPIPYALPENLSWDTTEQITHALLENRSSESTIMEMLFGPDERRLVEKRQALTSLQTYRPGRVGSLRVPISSGPGMIPGATASNKENAVISVYEDRGTEVRGAEAAPISIISVARRQDAPKENTLKPGPWTTVPVKKKAYSHKTGPSFTVHEDGTDSASQSFHCSFPPETLEDYSGWRVSLTIAEPADPRMIPMYPKDHVYIDPHAEYSIEELRSHRYNTKINRQRTENVETTQALQSILHCSGVMQQSFHEAKHDGLEGVVHPGIYNLPVNLENSTPFVFKSHQEDVNIQQISHIEHNLSVLRNVSASNKHIQNSHRESIQHAQQMAFAEPMLVPHQNSPGLSHQNSPGFGATSSPGQNLWGDHDNSKAQGFQIWNSSDQNTSEVSLIDLPKPMENNFAVYEQSLQESRQQHLHSKGSVMKTPFKSLNADELAETGSRGGMDIAATAQPTDSAKPMPLFSDDSSSSLEEIIGTDANLYTELNNSCNTQLFNFNLNAMKVSTPQSKQTTNNVLCLEDVKDTKKQLFSEPPKNDEKHLSTILEETKNYVSTSSSSGATTKSSLLSNHTTKHNNMATISEEHNSYLAQNLMANAALRSSLLGEIMDFDTHPHPLISEPAPMQSSPVESPVRKIPVPAVVKPLEHAPSDPFKASLLNKLLERIDFPGPHCDGFYGILSIPRLIVKKEPIVIGNERYIVEKQLGKGTFGTVFKAVDIDTNNCVALKYQKPANRWEFYICRELQARLANHPLREQFMDVTIGYFSDQSSILVSHFMPYGSLLDLANLVKRNLGRTMKEILCIYFTNEMLRIVEAMHEVKIIHADIKPDNFLVQFDSNGLVGLQLIDFGCSIDMTLFPVNTMFTRRITTEDFVCCEMRDGRPWSYHTDLFCVAATAHVLIFDNYIQLQKTDKLWSITRKFPRYVRIDLWNNFFSSLLNQHDGPADSKKLQLMFNESLECQKDELASQMRYLTNLISKR